MNEAINNMEVTAEEVEAMDALCRLATGKPLLEINPTTQDTLNNISIPQLSEARQKLTDFVLDTKPTPPTLETILNNICAQLQLLSTVITQTKAQPNAEDQSLQECVNLTLQQAKWFKDMVKESVEEKVDDMDTDYMVESAVETYFSNSFSLDDHVDITAEVEHRIEEIVEDQLADIVSDKLRNLRITFD